METLLRMDRCHNIKARGKSPILYLSIADRCNVQCNFRDRSSHCLNGNPPSDALSTMTPEEAIAHAKEVIARKPNISGIGIVGPGEPFASPEITLETLARVRKELPQMYLFVASNGLNVASYARKLAILNVNHVTITVNAVFPSIGALIHEWVRKNKKVLRGVQGAKVLIEEQGWAVRSLTPFRIPVKINTIVIPGVNLDHVIDIARWAESKGASIMECIPVHFMMESAFGKMRPPSEETMRDVIEEVGAVLPVATHRSRPAGDGRNSFKDSLSYLT